jgi:hypothetical protein
MNSVDRLLEQYVAAYRSGDTDPWPYLDQVEGEQRVELEEMIEIFLVNAGRATRTPDSLQDPGSQDPAAADFVDRLVADLLIPERGWRDFLPSLRLRNRIERQAVDSQLARALEARDMEESEKVADYYHDMEQGNLDPEGVSDRVLEALSDIYGTTVKVLRRVGETTRPPESRTVFARSDSESMDIAETGPSLSKPVFSRIKGEPDRIDRLFVDADGSGPGR